MDDITFNQIFLKDWAATTTSTRSTPSTSRATNLRATACRWGSCGRTSWSRSAPPSPTSAGVELDGLPAPTAARPITTSTRCSWSAESPRLQQADAAGAVDEPFRGRALGALGLQRPALAFHLRPPGHLGVGPRKLLDVLMNYNKAWVASASALIFILSDRFRRRQGAEPSPLPSHSFDAGAAGPAWRCRRIGWVGPPTAWRFDYQGLRGDGRAGGRPQHRGRHSRRRVADAAILPEPYRSRGCRAGASRSRRSCSKTVSPPERASAAWSPVCGRKRVRAKAVPSTPARLYIAFTTARARAAPLFLEDLSRGTGTAGRQILMPKATAVWLIDNTSLHLRADRRFWACTRWK